MPAAARSARAEAVSVPRPAPKVLARRTPPRPRRVRGLRDLCGVGCRQGGGASRSGREKLGCGGEGA